MELDPTDHLLPVLLVTGVPGSAAPGVYASLAQEPVFHP